MQNSNKQRSVWEVAQDHQQDSIFKPPTKNQKDMCLGYKCGSHGHCFFVSNRCLRGNRIAWLRYTPRTAATSAQTTSIWYQPSSSTTKRMDRNCPCVRVTLWLMQLNPSYLVSSLYVHLFLLHPAFSNWVKPEMCCELDIFRTGLLMHWAGCWLTQTHSTRHGAVLNVSSELWRMRKNMFSWRPQASKMLVICWRRFGFHKIRWRTP